MKRTSVLWQSIYLLRAVRADANARNERMHSIPTDDAKELTMDDIFTFLFTTRGGLAVLFFGGIVIVAVAGLLLERRTHKMYVDRGPKDDDLL